MSDSLTDALAFNLNPGMAGRLLRAHVDDGSGTCAGCSRHNLVRHHSRRQTGDEQ